MRMNLNICGLLLAGSSLVQGQAAPVVAGTDKDIPLSKVEHKNRAPVSKDILHVKLPKPVEAKLENGATVLILEDHRLPTISVQLLIQGAGGLFDADDRAGLASTVAAMMKEGTTTLNSRQVSEGIDDLGATLFFTAGFGTADAVVSASGLSENFDQWFALMINTLQTANFPDGELQKLKQRQITGLKQQRAQSSFLANEMFRKAVYGKHPASIVTATAASLQAMTSDELKAWRDQRYVPQNAILAIAGDVNAKTLIPKLNRMTATWKKTDYRAVTPPAPKAAEGRRVYLIDRPNSVQTNLVLGNLAIDRANPDFIALTVLNRILGGGAASRLFTNLREEKSYTYGAYSRFQASELVGPFSASSEVRTAVTDGAMTEFLKELNRIRDEKVPAAELEQAQHSLVSAFALSLEQPSEVLSYETTRKRFGLPENYWDTYPARIAAVTADDIERVAKKYIIPANLQIVAVGDASKIKTVMEKYGPVTVYNSDGMPVAQ